MANIGILSTDLMGYNLTCEDVDGTKKLVVKIDKDTLKSDADGVLSVDLDALGIKVVSDDAGNVISIGTDTGAFLDAHKIKQIVGEMVAGANDGLRMDGITETLHAYLASLGVTDTDTVDLTYTENEEGNNVLKADVKISTADDNALTVDVDNGGLYVAPAPEQATTNESTVDAEGNLVVSINNVAIPLPTNKLVDCSGNIIGYVLADV